MNELIHKVLKQIQKTYIKDPINAASKEYGKKILNIRNQIKAARDAYKVNNARLVSRQTERLNKYYSLEAKRTE